MRDVATPVAQNTRAFFYDANGEDREVDLPKSLPKISKQQLLWIDVVGRDGLDGIAKLLDLRPSTVDDLTHTRRAFSLTNFGSYVHFDVSTLALNGDKEPGAPKTPEAIKLDLAFSDVWLLTVHDAPVAFLDEFLEQDRGETLIGNLSPATLAAALLDLHVTCYLTAVERLETFVEGLDVRLLAKRSLRDDLLAQLVAGRRHVAVLRRRLGPQRGIFYGLARPDIALVEQSQATEHFHGLERRFERAIDTIEHARELMKGSFELFTTRVAETTNALIRRLTFLSLMLGGVGAIAGIFGMNFQTPYTSSGVAGFWMVITSLALAIMLATVISLYRKWL